LTAINEASPKSAKIEAMSEPFLPERIPSRCERCGKDDTMESATVRRAFVHDERVVVVEGIPAIVCRACGAEYCDDSAQLVQNILRGNGFRADEAVTHLQVPVFRFGDHLAKGRG
jgi:YgiT-type zinc finger domain-containing protein